MTKKKVFVAYPSNDATLAESIIDAIQRVNALPIPIYYEPWIFNDVSGNPLTSPILEKIDESPYVVADITYLNLNVVYEIGFAIGRKKRVFLIRSKAVDGDRIIAKAVGIFDTLGYFEYADSEELKGRISAHIEENGISFSNDLNRHSRVYLIEPPNRGSDVGTMVSRIKKAGYGRYRSFAPDEDSRLSATDAIQQVATSSGVFIPLQISPYPASFIHNIRCMFVAGLADGMGKPKLIISPIEFEVPLDVRDDAKRWINLEDIHRHVAEFCPTIVEYESQVVPSNFDDSTLLQRLRIGDPRAENEMATLDQYYLGIDQFERALRGEVNLIVGRKGSGKTALFIRLRDKIRSDKANIVIDLKPEGYQLIRLKEDILEYLSEGARQHLITAFWEYLIYSEIAYKILEKDKHVYRFNHEIYELYAELEEAYQAVQFSSEGDFSERLSTLSEKLSDSYVSQYGKSQNRRLTASEVTQLVYTYDISKLRKLISRYLEKKKSVWVLFDNLDKGWSTQGVDAIDAIVLRCLVDAGRKVEREMRKGDHTVHCIVFVRNDVYDHLMRNSPDYGKELRATLDWRDEDMLREMLRLRLISSLADNCDGFDFDVIWKQICISHYQGEETSYYMINRSLMRPRNFLKIFNHCRGFAANFGKQKIDDQDIKKGMEIYSSDLLEELDRELTDVFPEAKDLLYHFVDSKTTMSREDISGVFLSANISEDAHEKVLSFLLYYGVLGVKVGDAEYFIYTVNYDIKMLEIRASRGKGAARFLLNPAFWPAFGLEEEVTHH